MGESLTITLSNFEHEVLQAHGPVLVDFWAPWCGPCQIMGPVVEEVATQYAGTLKVGKLNVDDHPAVAQRYGITGIPALFFFQQGQVVDRVVGAVPKRVLQQHVENVVSHA
jgi:thioredoxin 1